jgi:aryl-alcohol dehydrogenase-like predicted oxidoreductase
MPPACRREPCRAGVDRARQRLGVERIDLMQFHWWNYTHPGYLDAMHELARLREEGVIAHLGTTNFDTDHLRLLARDGIPIATNQACFSLLDRRAADEMTVVCRANGVRLLAYGTLAGGFLSERWLGKPDPGADGIADWSKMKYRRFVDAAGGWDALQAILEAADAVARRHGVSIANVATRWVLDQPAVGAVILGARIGEREHRADNLRCFAFDLDAADHARLDAAFARSPRLARSLLGNARADLQFRQVLDLLIVCLNHQTRFNF